MIGFAGSVNDHRKNDNFCESQLDPLEHLAASDEKLTFQPMKVMASEISTRLARAGQ